MKESNVITKFNVLKRTSELFGITLQVGPGENIGFFDVPGSNGFIGYNTLEEVEIFLRGYELGYKSYLYKKRE